MSRPSGKSLSLLVTVAVAAITLVYVMFVFLPVSKSIASLRGQFQQQRQFVMNANQQYAMIGTLQQELDRTQLHLRQWQQQRQRIGDFPAFLSRVSEISREAGVALDRVTPADPRELRTVCQYPVELTVHGQFHQISAFLHRLEELAVTVWFDRMLLQAEGEDGQVLQCELNLTVFSDNPDTSG